MILCISLVNCRYGSFHFSVYLKLIIFPLIFPNQTKCKLLAKSWGICFRHWEVHHAHIVQSSYGSREDKLELC